MGHEERTYRRLYKGQDLYHFQVAIEETDLDIAIKKSCFNTELGVKLDSLVRRKRAELLEYIKRDPQFITALEPHEPQPFAPLALVEMCKAARLAGVGPMAAVAGMFSEQIGRFLTSYSSDVIVENGGDIWLKSTRSRQVGVFAGRSPFTGRIALEIKAAHTPIGICTSSATVGHSLSFGKADAVIILAPSAVLADAVATAACNMVQCSDDLEKAVNFAVQIPGVSGAVAILGDVMAAQGQVMLI